MDRLAALVRDRCWPQAGPLAASLVESAQGNSDMRVGGRCGRHRATVARLTPAARDGVAGSICNRGLLRHLPGPRGRWNGRCPCRYASPPLPPLSS